MSLKGKVNIIPKDSVELCNESYDDLVKEVAWLEERNRRLENVVWYLRYYTEKKADSPLMDHFFEMNEVTKMVRQEEEEIIQGFREFMEKNRVNMEIIFTKKGEELTKKESKLYDKYADLLVKGKTVQMRVLTDYVYREYKGTGGSS